MMVAYSLSLAERRQRRRHDGLVRLPALRPALAAAHLPGGELFSLLFSFQIMGIASTSALRGFRLAFRSKYVRRAGFSPLVRHIPLISRPHADGTGLSPVLSGVQHKLAAVVGGQRENEEDGLSLLLVFGPARVEPRVERPVQVGGKGGEEGGTSSTTPPTAATTATGCSPQNFFSPAASRGSCC